MRGLVDAETHDLFQKKLRDRALRREENFRWCAHVSILLKTCLSYECKKCDNELRHLR